MGYVVVKGGEKAILNAEKLVDYFRLSGDSSPLDVKAIEEQFRIACDKVMSEGSLYAPELAALALKQTEGDTIEASFLLRAYRSTLPRIGYSEPTNGEEMFVLRRISSAFKEIPGGQILGPTRDYVLRLLRFGLLKEGKEVKKEILFQTSIDEDKLEAPPEKIPKVLNALREEGILPKSRGKKGKEPYDITREALVFPLPRSGILQALARGEEGGMMAIAYSSMRGYGDIHPTLAELRVGYVPLKIKHPLTGEVVKVGDILVTETEVIMGAPTETDGEVPQFILGYGLIFGHNERKSICMAMLDVTLKADPPKHPSEDQEFVLYHIDSIESSGFTNHWKLPHYVTFQSDLDRLRKIQEKKRMK